MCHVAEEAASLSCSCFLDLQKLIEDMSQKLHCGKYIWKSHFIWTYQDLSKAKAISNVYVFTCSQYGAQLHIALCRSLQHLSERKLLSGIYFQVQRNPTDPVTQPIVISECDWFPSGGRMKPLACGQKAGAFCPFTSLPTL